MRNAKLLPIAAMLLAPLPGGAAEPADVPPDAVIATLPFLEVEEPNRIYLDLAEEGSEPFRLLLDTGATHAVMTPRAARAAGVSVRAVKDTPYRRATRLGRDLQFWVNTLSSDTAARTFEYGVLGGDFLKSFVVEIDCAARAVRFLDPRRYALRDVPSAPDQAVLPIRDSPRPILEIAVGAQRLAVIADTGAPWPIVLSGRAARKAGIDVDSLPAFLPTEWALGPVEMRLYEAPELTIGGYRFRGVPVLVAPQGMHGYGGEADDSLIGYDLLSRFLVRIDHKSHRVLLRRTSEQVVFYGVDYAVQRRSGAFVMPVASGFRVVAVLPESAASRRGVRTGDFIERSRPSTTPESALAEIADGKPFRVLRGDGASLERVELAAGGAAAAP